MILSQVLEAGMSDEEFFLIFDKKLIWLKKSLFRRNPQPPTCQNSQARLIQILTIIGNSHATA
jgi:hypothetical protein